MYQIWEGETREKREFAEFWRMQHIVQFANGLPGRSGLLHFSSGASHGGRGCLAALSEVQECVVSSEAAQQQKASDTFMWGCINLISQCHDATTLCWESSFMWWQWRSSGLRSRTVGRLGHLPATKWVSSFPMRVHLHRHIVPFYFCLFFAEVIGVMGSGHGSAASCVQLPAQDYLLSLIPKHVWKLSTLHMRSHPFLSWPLTSDFRFHAHRHRHSSFSFFRVPTIISHIELLEGVIIGCALTCQGLALLLLHFFLFFYQLFIF